MFMIFVYSKAELSLNVIIPLELIRNVRVRNGNQCRSVSMKRLESCFPLESKTKNKKRSTSRIKVTRVRLTSLIRLKAVKIDPFHNFAITKSITNLYKYT